MKLCVKCKMGKDFEFFNKDSSREDGLFPWCKVCKGESNKEYRAANPNRMKEWRAKNPDYMSEYNKVYYEENKEYFAQHIRRYNKENREWFREYENRKRKEDINYRLAKNLRGRIRHALKSGSVVKDLGCSIEELKQYLEFQFQPDMSWENYGPNGWHVDHIKPLVGFDLTDRKQFLEACHYSNLQPLWAKENLSKGGKLLKLHEF